VPFNITADVVDRLLNLAQRAGKVIMEIYETDFEVRTKNDASPVTIADERAEAVILEELEALAPKVPRVGEESYAAGYRPDISAGEFWLVDALDGTKEFTNRGGEFTVNIAHIVNGVPQFGVVHAPAIQDTYWGTKAGAFQTLTGGHTAEIKVRAPAADGVVVLTSRSHRSGEAEFLKDYTIKEERHASSSIKFCVVAAGEADLYPRLGPTHEWDTAAGHAVLLAAGGAVTTLDGKPLLYGKGDLLNPHFVARGRTS